MKIRLLAAWLLAITLAVYLEIPAAKARAAVPVTIFCKKEAYCYGVAKRADGRIDFRIQSFSFTGTYRLCVTDPDKARVCHRYRLGRFTKSSVVDWKQNFPHASAGQYRVQWRRLGGKLGPDAYFHSSMFGNPGPS